jgi:hypothetical protein
LRVRTLIFSLTLLSRPTLHLILLPDIPLQHNNKSSDTSTTYQLNHPQRIPYQPSRTTTHPSPTMRTTTAILTALFSILALATATPIQAIPPLSPPPYLDVYPGGSIFLVSDTPGQRPTEFRQPIDINKVTVLEPQPAPSPISHRSNSATLSMLTRAKCNATLTSMRRA